MRRKPSGAAKSNAATTPLRHSSRSGVGRGRYWLHHPHIVPIYQIGTHESRPFFAMEWIASGNLSARLRGALPAARPAAGWLRALGQAVAHARSRGVVHRDLKPANILLDHTDQPFLTDFSLAKLLGTESDLTLTGLADELKRFLNGPPIRARPVPCSERIWRACRPRADSAASAARVRCLGCERPAANVCAVRADRLG